MRHSDFQIGQDFYASAGFRWRCTDKGVRTITAILLDPDKDASWFTGPPYMVEEVVFDELDFESCHPIVQDILYDRMNELVEKSTWFFSMEEMTWLFQKDFRRPPRSLQKLLKRDRVGSDNHRLHPGGLKDNMVHAIDLLTREKVTMDLDAWRSCILATSEHPGEWRMHPKDVKSRRKKPD